MGPIVLVGLRTASLTAHKSPGVRARTSVTVTRGASGLTALSIAPMSKVDAVNVSAIREILAKIDGIAILDESTVAVTNDNDFDIGRFDLNGNNVGNGLKTQLIIIKLDTPLLQE